MIDSDLKSSLVRDKKLWINESAYHMDHISTVAHKDKTLSRFQNTSQNSKNTSQNPKHVPESKNTSQNPKRFPRIQNRSKNPKHIPESGFWKVFLNSGTCFGFREVFFGFWEVFCPYEPPYISA